MIFSNNIQWHCMTLSCTVLNIGLTDYQVKVLEMFTASLILNPQHDRCVEDTGRHVCVKIKYHHLPGQSQAWETQDTQNAGCFNLRMFKFIYRMNRSRKAVYIFIQFVLTYSTGANLVVFGLLLRKASGQCKNWKSVKFIWPYLAILR